MIHSHLESTPKEAKSVYFILKLEYEFY